MLQNSAIVANLLTYLAKLGVREFCVAAGARNAQIVAVLEASSGIRIWSFFEERCAGFFALGRSLQSGAPVAVVTTSGTAAAELLPAMIEAYYQGLPLIAVTADRPPHYRGSGAPQAIEQVGIFGSYAPPTLDISSPEFPSPPSTQPDGPLHINVCLDEGIVVDERQGIDFDHFTPIAQRQGADQRNEDESVLIEFLQHRPIVLAGGLRRDQAATVWPFLEKLGLPVVAEATANLHGHPCICAGGEEQLAGLDAKFVLRMGAVPSWRWWRDLEALSDVHVLNLTDTLLPGLGRRENVQTLRIPRVWPKVAFDQSRVQIAASVSVPEKTHSPLSETDWMEKLAAVIPAGSQVFLGNSLPIRQFNQIRTPLARHTFCYANRGANGIDGLVSTYLGLSAGDDGSESWIILGDLSALYDLAAPWILPQLPKANRRIVVINNGGGKIFSKVASLRALPEAARSIIENRHTLSFASWADLWQIPYRRVTQPEQLGSLPAGAVLIEIVPA